MHTRMLAASLLCFWLMGMGSAGLEADAVARGREAFQRAQSAYLEKNFSAYREAMHQAVRLRPRLPPYLYNLAGAEALTGHAGEALKWLDRLARMGMTVNPSQDDDFSSLRGNPGFEKVPQRLKWNRLPTGGGRPLFRVHQKGLIAEGLTRDPTSGDFFLGSVRQRKILRVDGKTFQVRDFSAPGDGLDGVFGMKVDATRGILWACSSSLAEMEGYHKSEDGRAGLFQYDLKSGKLLGKHFPPEGYGKHLFGDLAVDAMGTVFVTDSLSPGLWMLRVGGSGLEPFLVPGPFSSAQGLDFSADGKKLFVADYSWGIFNVDRSTRKATLLDSPEDVTLLGIDGLYRRGRDLLAVQNGIRPNRLVVLRLAAGEKRVEGLRVLEANTAYLDSPTLGVLEEKRICLIANSEWEAFDPSRGGLDPTKTRFPTILEISLAGGR